MVDQVRGSGWLHMLPKPTYRFWGKQVDEYDGADLHNVGLGPLLIFGWRNR